MSEEIEKSSVNVQDNKTDSKPSKEKKSRKDKPKPLMKVVVRRLPPSMTEETFLKQIEPIPDHDYFYFVPADWSLGLNASGRAYINFVNQDDIFIFKDKFDGYIFIDSKGAEYPAVVEFAPFQGLPKNKARKKDNKSNSIETDQHFISFLESLKTDDSENGKGEMKLEYSYQFRDDKKIKSTPLLEYIASKKQEKRDEKKRKVEEKRKQRDEDRQKKKIQIAKNVPSAISEEPNKDGGDIIVRTIKSRPLDRNRNRKEKSSETMKPKSNGDEKVKIMKEERDRKRFEKDQQRKLEREKRYEERKKEEKKEKFQNKQENKTVDNIKSVPLADEVVKKEVKKYSERRREGRMRADKQTEVGKVNENKEIEKKDLDPSIENNLKVENSDNSTSVETKELPRQNEDKVTGKPRSPRRENRNRDREREREERIARRIKNKDRPSIQIYQPGRSRLISTKKSDEKDDNEKSPNKSEESQGLEFDIKMTDKQEQDSQIVKQDIESSDQLENIDNVCEFADFLVTILKEENVNEKENSAQFKNIENDEILKENSSKLNENIVELEKNNTQEKDETISKVNLSTEDFSEQTIIVEELKSNLEEESSILIPQIEIMESVNETHNEISQPTADDVQIETSG